MKKRLHEALHEKIIGGSEIFLTPFRQRRYEISRVTGKIWYFSTPELEEAMDGRGYKRVQ